MRNNERSKRRLPQPAALLAALAVVVPLAIAAPGQGPSSFSSPPLPDHAAAGPQAAPAPAPSTDRVSLRPIEAGRMVAKIGSQIVLVSELMWPINQELAKRGVPLEVVEQVREQAMASLQVQLARLLEDKLILNELYEKVPPEGIEQTVEHLSEPFEDQLVPRMIEEFNVKSRGELDARLRQYGSSLAQIRQGFVDTRLARAWIDQQTGGTPEVTLDDLQREYEEHLEDYAYPAKVRWQELMVRFDRFPGDQRAAYSALVDMGNRVVQFEAGRGGAPFETVARQFSHGVTASEGGLHDWTAQGSLVAEKVDAALFVLPVGRRSEIIPSQEGYHIVRVLERQPAGTTPFEEAQIEIREKLISGRREAKQQEYVDKLRKEVQIWTIYTGPTTAEEYFKYLASLRE